MHLNKTTLSLNPHYFCNGLATPQVPGGVQGVSVGAILSDYQRVRVENVCGRLGLTPIAYLWRQSQPALLADMIHCGTDAVLIKVAAMGLKPAHLGKTLAEMQGVLQRLHDSYDVHVCGEGGEFETLTVDSPLFYDRLVLAERETIVHSDDAFAPVAFLKVTAVERVPKETGPISQADRVEAAKRLVLRPGGLLDTPIWCDAEGGKEQVAEASAQEETIPEVSEASPMQRPAGIFVFPAQSKDTRLPPR